jgi:bacillolysin
MFGLRYQNLVTAVIVAAGLAVAAVRVTGQEPRASAPAIQSLAEPGQGLDVKARSDKDGRVRFAASSGRGVLLPGMAAARAEARAMAFVELYGESFGLRARSDARPLGPAQTDGLGVEHVRLQQLHDGVPVTAGEFLVHLRGERVMAANGRTLSDLPALLSPTLTPSLALEQAQALITKHLPDQAGDARYSEPRLEVFNRGMIDQGTYPTRLAWFVEASGDALRQYIWIDAHSGAVLLDFSQLTEVKNRATYNMNHDQNNANLPGMLARSEGDGPVADADVNQAHDFAGQTYDYYFVNHGRDSFDNAGGQLRSSVHFGTNYGNAFWNGTQMVYGDGFTAADDVVAHELTHAVTDLSAHLLYYQQSGALNESFSDIFGETMDLTTGLTAGDLEPQRWQVGEDLSIGAIRNMMTPTFFGDPGKMSDSGQFVCRSDAATSDDADSGGVHSNSGVPNHAFALMVDGGSYNGRTITGIGLTKAAKIQYRALTTYLTSGSTFADNANALNQSCSDLTGTLGITSADCTQVNNAILAVEMTSVWPCNGATPPPATYCPAGSGPVALFADGFESGGANWTASSTTTTNWLADTDFAKTGIRMAYGPDGEVPSDHSFAMTSAVTLPANARMSFDQAFEFEHSTTTTNRFDGGVLEYSTNGTTWTDAGSLIDAGQAYNGTLSNAFLNPLGGRTAFTRSSFGYTSTRLNLAALAGQPVRFRFRIGTDAGTGSLGWAVDNVRLYTCAVTAAAPTTVNDGYATPPDTPLQVVAPGVLANDNSNGGGAMSAALLGNVSSGTLALNANGSFTYTPNAGFTGTDSFTYQAVNATGPGNPATVSIIVNAITTPQPPTGFHVASLAGNVVTFRWTPPAAGPAPTGYVLEGGLPGGPVIASIPTGSAAPIYTVVAPNGSFYIRMLTETAAGRSAASNEISIHVNVPVPPTAPANLLGLVNGNNIALAWQNTFGGGPTANVLLDVTGPVTTTLSLGAGEGFQFASVPNGTYTLSLRARNAGGISASSSNSVTLTFPGPCAGVPQVPLNVLAFKSGATIFVYWDPPAGGPAPTAYVVDATGSFNGSISTTGRALSGSASPGTYNLRVRAVNPCGSGPASPAQSVTIP